MSGLLDRVNFPDDIRGLSDKELKQLASEIREFIIEKVSKTGGHLASNLGVVELTLAIHSVYDTPTDRIIWDVGHQTYVHKIITGRKDKFDGLRQYNGLSGFPKRSESIYDVFETGHSSTSISAALGMSRARDIKHEDYKVVAVIGDGALTGGMAFEALNDAGDSNTDLTVILNDNEMSIAHNVGSLATYLSKFRTDPAYHRFKQAIERFFNAVPGIGKPILNSLDRFKRSLKYYFVPNMFFEDLGFTYLGPINGHDIGSLKYVLGRSKKIKGPVLIHVYTKKGKGYEFAEKRPDKFHGIGAFDIGTGECAGSSKCTYSGAFSDEIVKMAKQDDRIVAITAAMREGTGLEEFAKQFPERFFDVGIAEQHAVTLAAGLAANGMKPVFAVYSTFLQRGYDQVLHDVCMQKLPVVFAIDRSGIVGDDGETHQGVFDLSFLRSIPNMVIMAPKSISELRRMLHLGFKLDRPVAIRYPKGCEEPNAAFAEEDGELTPYKAEVLLRGRDALIIAAGSMVSHAYQAVLRLKNCGIEAGLINARFIKPLDAALILDEVRNYKNIVTIEDNTRVGGFGAGIMEMLSDNDIAGKRVKLLGFPDEFIPQGSREILYGKYGLDAEGIASSVTDMILRQ